MRIDREYHHFKGNHLTRSERVERFAVNELVNTTVPDAERESSQAWELMHSSTCKAFMHVLAEKRGVSVELARVAGALHDYYVIRTGKYKNHAQLGAPLVREVLGQLGGFSDQEVTLVCEMVANHSDKQIYTDSPHVELIKDVDVFDCSLYYGTEFYYLTRKPLPVCHEYFKRILQVREELGMLLPSAYRCLSREENGPLADMGDAVPTTEPWAPTTAMLALWAFSSSDEAKDLPLVLVHGHNGGARWLCPQNFISGAAGGGGGLPQWEAVRQFTESAARGMNDASRWASGGAVREMLETCREAMVPAWAGFRAAGTLRECTAVELRDLTCDPDADAKLAALLRQRIAANQAEPTRPADGASPTGWHLDPAQELLVDQLGRAQALADLRGEVVRRSRQLLATASERSGRDVLRQFPSEVFGCEESPHVPDEKGQWLAVAWPRFGRFELTVGSEAEDRLAALMEYLKSTGGSVEGSFGAGRDEEARRSAGRA